MPSILHASNFLNNCYWNANVISHGTEFYAIVSYLDWISTMMTARIVGSILSAAGTSTYVVFLWLVCFTVGDWECITQYFCTVPCSFQSGYKFPYGQ